MANASNAQTSFLGGEWSKTAQGRTDHPRYKTAMNRCLNGYPVEGGAWVRRSGFRRAAYTRGGARARLIPFTFSTSLPYNMELTAGHIRMFKGKDLVPAFEAVGAVSSINTATPAAVTLSSAVDWETGDVVYFEFPDALSKFRYKVLANRQFTITVSSTTVFTLTDMVTGASIDGNTINWNSSYTLAVRKVLDLETDYTSDQLDAIRPVQSDEEMFLLHRDKIPQVLTMETEPSGSFPAEFSIDDAQFLDGPYLDPVSGSVATPSALTGNITLTLSLAAYSSTKAYKKGDYVTSAGVGYRSISDVNVGKTPASYVGTYWELANPGEVVGPNGFTSSDIGRHVRMYSAGTTWTWGRITGFATSGVINYSTTTHTPFGNMTSGAGLGAAFNGISGETEANSAYLQSSVPPFGSLSAYAGVNYAVAQTIGSVVIFPSSDKNFIDYLSWSSGEPVQLVFKLWASHTAPASAGDGTLLGETSGMYNPSSSIAITSTNQSTAWEYVWIEVLAFGTVSSYGNARLIASEVQMFTPAAPAPGTAVTVEVLGPDLASTAAMDTWRLGLYSDSTGWPTCGCWHEGRLWLGGAVKNRFDASVSNEPFNFAPTNATGTVADSNAISYKFNSSDQNEIVWMKPDLNGIVAGTVAGEWLIQATNTNAILTPTSIQAHRVTKYGCAAIEPKATGLTTVFVQKFKRRIMEYLADAYSNKHYGPNLNEFSQHITDSGIEELAYQEELAPILWARRADGTLVGATYRRVKLLSSESAEFYGWHEHEHGSGSDITSIAVGPDLGGTIDALSIVVQEPVTGRYAVEVLASQFEETDGLTDSAFLDSSIVPSCIESVTVDTTDKLRLHGLWPHIGKEVTAFLGGLDCGEFTVTASGYIDVPYDSDLTVQYLLGLGSNGEDYGDLACTADGGSYTVPALVGNIYTSRGQTLRPGTREDSGAMSGPPMGKLRRVHKFAALLEKTKGISFGTTFDRLRPAIFKKKSGSAYGATELFSGTYRGTMDDETSLDGMLAWEITRPFPATVASIGGFLSTQDQ